MPLIPLKLPAGIKCDGTEFENSGTWRDGNLIRWVNGSLRPVGGWQLRNSAVQASNLKYGDYDPTTINDDTDPSYSGAITTGVGYGNNFYGGQQDMGEPPRAMLAWADNSQDVRIVIGSANVLYSINENQQAFDITPPDLEEGDVNAGINLGYSGSYFGIGSYGVPRVNLSFPNQRLTISTASSFALNMVVTQSNTNAEGEVIAIGAGYIEVKNKKNVRFETQTASESTNGWLTRASFEAGDPADVTGYVTLVSDIPTGEQAYIECTTWALENWGEYLLACSSTDGRIFEWQLNTGVDPAVVSNAPTDNGSMMVTEERFVFAFGGKKSGEAVRNPRRVMWSDREDNTTWTASATNEAGDIELQTQGEIMCGLRVRGRSLILTNEDAHLATYQGPPYVYGFERAGTSCGVIGRKAAVQAKEGAFWMGHSAFFMFDGSSAQKIPCPVTDHIFGDINYNQASKVYAVHNNKFGEVWWFYPSGNSIENDSYVAFNYVEGYWTHGKLARTCGIDSGVFNYPIYAGVRGNLYSHEFGHRHEDIDGTYYYPYVESNPISLGNGDQVMRVSDLIPDENTQGNVRLIFKTRFHPNDEEREYGPYDPSNPTSVRFTGRQIRMRLEAAVEFDLIRAALNNAANLINPEKKLFAWTFIEPDGTVNIATTVAQATTYAATGRALGDVNNSGSVTTDDADIYQDWLDGTVIDPEYKLYIEETLNPYLLANESTYSAYLYRNATDWRVGAMRIEAAGGGRR